MAYIIYSDKCNLCGNCVEECPLQAITREGDDVVIDPEICRRADTARTFVPRVRSAASEPLAAPLLDPYRALLVCIMSMAQWRS